MTFRTHTGETVTGARLQAARGQAANDGRELGRAIREENAYADHVTEAEKKTPRSKRCLTGPMISKRATFAPSPHGSASTRL